MSETQKKILFRLGIACFVGVILITAGFIVFFAARTAITARPMVKAIVTNASLTQFNLSSSSNNSNIYYDLALEVAVRNSKGTKVNYKRIQVIASYKDIFTLGNFTWQGVKNKTVILHPPNFQGQQFVMLSEENLSVFRSETAAGAYSIDVVVYLKIFTKPFSCRTLGKCLLKVPLSLNHTSTNSSFKTTKCSMSACVP